MTAWSLSSPMRSPRWLNSASLTDATRAGRNVGQLAGRLGLPRDLLTRLVKALASCGFFELGDDGRVTLTALGQLLRTDTAVSMRATLSNIDSYRTWLSFIETSRAGWPHVTGGHRAQLFSHHAEDAGGSAAFDVRMRERAARVYASLPAIRNWDANQRVLDIGGGTGTVLGSLLRALPALRGVLLDRAAVIQRVAGSNAFDGVSDRCELVAGDFFAALPEGADVHLLCSVLHNWEDEAACEILRRSRESLSPGGTILICEMLLPLGCEPHPAHWSDLSMLILVGGRERTISEYSSLLEKTGFRLVTVTPLPDTSLSLIEAC